MLIFQGKYYYFLPTFCVPLICFLEEFDWFLSRPEHDVLIL